MLRFVLVTVFGGVEFLELKLEGDLESTIFELTGAGLTSAVVVEGDLLEEIAEEVVGTSPASPS